MSTQTNTARNDNQPQAKAHTFTRADARRARVSYQHIAQIVNLIVNRVIQTLDHDRAATFKPVVFQTIHALHGMFNGREVSKDYPLFRAHIYTAPHFGFQDTSKAEIALIQADDSLTPEVKENKIEDVQAQTEENARRLVCRRLNDLAEAETAGGRQLVFIRRGDGVTQKLTAYEGHPLLDAAEALYLTVRNTPGYAKNPSAAITEEMLDGAVASLPTIASDASVTAKGDRAPMDAGDLMTDAVLKAMWTKIVNSAERTLTKEFETGGDPELVARKYAAKIEKIGKDIKQRLARERLRAFSSMGDEDTDAPTAGEGVSGDGKNNVGHVEGGKTVTEGEDNDVWGDNVVGVNDDETAESAPFYPVTDVRVTESQIVETQAVGETPFSENVNLRLRHALEYAAQGIEVLPLWGVADGICDCRAGSACRSVGKHPHSKLARNGVYNATTDAARIRSWFDRDPRVNLGVAMGGKLNLICVDIDPRNAGDTSYHDLVKAHGDDAFPETFVVKTGGGGWHKYYFLPEEIKPKTGELKGSLAPGIDIKGAGGLIVAPGSIHASGRLYEVESNTYIAKAPEWIVASLRKSAAGDQPEKAIDFQAHRDRKKANISGLTIVEGERNRKVFEIGCAIWGGGGAQDDSDLREQLLAINNEHCLPALDDAEVEKIVASIGRYTRGPSVTFEKNEAAL
jgi:hypothetical protein